MKSIHLVIAAFACAGAAGAVESTPLAPAEAQAALRRAHWPKRETGYYHRQERLESRGRVTMTDSWEWRREDGQRFMRKEVRRQRTKNRPHELRRVTLVTPEGIWSLHEKVAVLQSFKAEKDMMAAKAVAFKNKLAGLSDAAREDELVKLGELSGIRTIRDGRVVLVVTFVYGEMLQGMMRDMADDAVDQTKKRVPLLLRPLVSAAIIAKGGVSAQLPVKRVTEIDEATDVILRERQLKADGTEAGGRQGTTGQWQRCEPLPPEQFTVPSHLQRVEAKSLAEFIELEIRYGEEDRQLRAEAKQKR